MSEPRLVVAILAAGGSSRLGRPKQLEPLRGEPLLRRQARIAADANVGTVAVVLGASFEACSAVVADLPVTIIRNDAWAAGLSTSLRAAVAFARGADARGLLILLGDQHAVTADDVRHVAHAWRSRGTTSTVATRQHSGAPGPPAVIPRSRFDAIDLLHGDVGARQVLAASPTLHLLDLPNAQPDLDTEADIVRIRDGLA